MRLEPRWKTTVLIVASPLLCACPSVRSHALPEPEPVVAQGLYVHAASGFAFPEHVAGFERDAVHRFDEETHDIGVAYNLVSPTHRIAATVFVYPAPALTSIGSSPRAVTGARAHLTEAEFQRNKQDIEAAHRGARLIEERDVTRTEGDRSVPGRLAVYEYEEESAGVRWMARSRLYLYGYVGDEWAVKYRITHPRADDADGEIQAFLDGWDWSAAGG